MRSPHVTRAAGVLTGVALSLSAVTMAAPAAVHASEKHEPCARQQAQVTKAEDALARVSVVFKAHQDKVKKAKEEVEEADTAIERRQARKELREAKARAEKVKATKRAHLQRLAKAQARLVACEEAHAEPASEPTP